MGKNFHESSKIMEGAKILGDVTLGENASVWYNAVLRADSIKIEVGKNSNVQDNCVIHGEQDVIIGENVSVGHGAVLHGCKIGDNVLIGMGAVIMDGSYVGKNCLVAAGTVITKGQTFEDNMLIMGVPGKARRALSEEEVKGNLENAELYVELSRKHAEGNI